MLGALYIKVAAVGMSIPDSSWMGRPTGDLEYQVGGQWGAPGTHMNPLGKFDSSDPAWTKAMAEQPSERKPLPAHATHRDRHGNFYVRDADGNYARMAVDYNGAPKLFPVKTTPFQPGPRQLGPSGGRESGLWKHEPGKPDTWVPSEAPMQPGIMVEGRGETRESMGGDLVTVEEGLGLTDVQAARETGSTHVDQAGKFYTSGSADMVPMEQVNPSMARNYTNAGLTPPQVDRSYQSTAERWRADPANATAVANMDAHAARTQSPAYQAKLQKLYANGYSQGRPTGVAYEARPDWVNTEITPTTQAAAAARIAKRPTRVTPAGPESPAGAVVRANRAELEAAIASRGSAPAGTPVTSGALSSGPSIEEVNNAALAQLKAEGKLPEPKPTTTTTVTTNTPATSDAVGAALQGAPMPVAKPTQTAAPAASQTPVAAQAGGTAAPAVSQTPATTDAVAPALTQQGTQPSTVTPPTSPTAWRSGSAVTDALQNRNVPGKPEAIGQAVPGAVAARAPAAPVGAAGAPIPGVPANKTPAATAATGSLASKSGPSATTKAITQPRVSATTKAIGQV